MNIENVKSLVKIIGNYDDAQLETYSAIIENAAAIIFENTKGDESANSKAVYLAAAKANYEIALILSAGDSVASFKAGDISISENSKSLEYAKEIFENARCDCKDIIIDESFAFLGV